MELRDLVRILRRRILVIPVTMLACVVIAGAYSLVVPRTYESTVTLFVATTAGDDPTQLLQGGDFVQQRVKSYARAITSPLVLEPVIADLTLDTDVDELRRRITAFVPAETVLIEISVRDSDPVLAAATAEAVANEFIGVVPTLEGAAGPSPVTVTLMEPASEPEKPVTPQPSRDLLIALAVGLGLGMVLAVVRHATDSRIDDERAVGEITSIPVVGAVPYDGGADGLRREPSGPRAEAFRALRTNLRLGPGGEPRSLVVTSATPGEGASSVAVNLARAVAGTGTPVCVVEANFSPRAPMANELGLSDRVTLAEILTDRTPLDAAVPATPSSGWYVIPAGEAGEAGPELLSSDAMVELLDDLLVRFRTVIVDAPPLLESADATLLGNLTGGALLVARPRYVRRTHLAQSVVALERADVKVLGVVLNG